MHAMLLFFVRLTVFLTWLKQHWKLALVVAILIAGGGFFWWRQVQSKTKPFAFVQPEYRDLQQVLEVSGVIDADTKARLRFIAGGKLTYIGSKTGDMVKKGQTIARIDQATLQKQLNQDLNDFMQERITWDSQRYEESKKTYQRQDYWGKDQGQLELQNAVLTVEIRDIAIKNTLLTAPFTGILTQSPADYVGEVLLSTDAFELIDPASLVMRADVDEADIAKVKIGQSVEIRLDSYPDDPVPTHVSTIAVTSTQSTSGTVFTVTIPITNTDNLNYFRLGMNGDARITLATKEHVLSVPLAATRNRDGKVFVDVKTEQGTIEKEIKTGLETDDYVEITSGISQSDSVVMPE